MSKLHELLAVETNLRGQAEAVRNDLKKTFTEKKNHFTKKVVTVRSTEEDGPPEQTETQLSLQTTVAKELEWISEKLSKAFDAAYQIDVANTTARADIVLENGAILATNVPATQLLQLEKRIKEVQELVLAIPTLDPSKGFSLAPTEGANIFQARDEVRTKTEKRWSFTVMVAATDKLPAQVKEHSLDVPVATVITQEWSSMLTVNDKSLMLDRVEQLVRAVKSARARANEIDIDVKSNKIGMNLLNYVFKG